MIPNLVAGVVALIGISGVGRLLIRPLRPLALHWYAALAMLAGIALSSTSIQCLAMAGSGRLGYRVLAAVIVTAGLAGHWAGRRRYAGLALPPRGWFRTGWLGLLCLVTLVLVLISLAPSTKIDEVHYHMLVGRRILEDRGLRVYQLPAEQAIVPQMAYQIAQTVFHATGTMDAGNIVSLAFGLVLWLMIYGVVTEETRDPRAGLMAVAAGMVGLFPAVFHVTAGPHALGDLATFTAVAALLFPGSRSGFSDEARSLAAVLGAACAASTKISLVPVSALIAIAVLLRLRKAVRVRMAGAAIGVWLLVLGPLVWWTYWHTGSPFGAAFAWVFGRTAYQPVVFQALADSRAWTQTALGPALWSLVIFLNGASILLMIAGVAVCLFEWRKYAALLVLVALQVVLIVIFLPSEFRFLGGLQYGLLAVGMIGTYPLWKVRIPPKWIRPRVIGMLSLVLLGPWLAVEMYYSRPFVAVSLGLVSREAFLDRFIACRADFQALDRILPRGVKIYVPDSRLPAVYAPRPVILTLEDWDRRTPLYRLLVADPGEPIDTSGLEPQAGLTCGPEVYRNNDARTAVFRAPGYLPLRGAVVVQPCLPAAGR